MSKIVVRLNEDVKPTGSDLAVVNAARRSFNTRSDWEYLDAWSEAPGILKDKDKRLLHFLARGMTADDFDKFVQEVQDISDDVAQALTDKDEQEFKEELIQKLWDWRQTPTHDTPFNHCFISFEVKAPVFVARQLVKHEYLIMSEFSRRYITDDIEFYEPDYWRKAAPNKKQGSLEEPVDLFEHKMWDAGILGPYMLGEEMQEGYQERNVGLFKRLLEAGVAPEQARMVLPQSTMTEWTWSGTLGAFAKMCQLRIHPDAQYESRLVANKVYEYLKEYYPVSAKALVEGSDV